MMKGIVAAAASLFAIVAGCSTASGPSRGKQVEIVSNPAPECRLIERVNGAYFPSLMNSYNALPASLLERGAQDDLLERAADLGATHVVLETSEGATTGTISSGRAAGVAYQCPRVATAPSPR